MIGNQGFSFDISETKTIIITGASGYVGRHVVNRFLKEGYDLIVTTRKAKNLEKFDWSSQVHICEVDITDPSSWCAEFERSSGLIHLAWPGLSNFRDDSHVDQAFPASLDFLERIAQIGVEHILVTGTCLEYGLSQGQISSDQATSPQIPYAIAKDLLNKKLKELSVRYGFTLQWARLFYSFGSGQSESSIIPLFLAAIRENKDRFDMSMGQQLRDYLPIEAVAQQIFDLYQSKQTGDFNICRGTPISVKQLIQEFRDRYQSSIELNLGAYPYPDYEPLKFWGKRDIPERVYLPALPNAPEREWSNNSVLGLMSLRRNIDTGFFENAAFDASCIDYTEGYENSQGHSEKFKSHFAILQGGFFYAVD